MGGLLYSFYGERAPNTIASRAIWRLGVTLLFIQTNINLQPYTMTFIAQ